MMPRPNSRSCRTASIRSGRAGGLAGKLGTDGQAPARGASAMPEAIPTANSRRRMIARSRRPRLMRADYRDTGDQGQAACVCHAPTLARLPVGITPINNPRLYPGKNPDLDSDTIDALAN